MINDIDQEKCYIVEMLRWNDDHNHSYVVGAFKNLHDAYTIGLVHEFYRGGKYTCRVTEFPENDVYFQEFLERFFEDTMSESKFALELRTRVDQHTGEYDG